MPATDFMEDGILTLLFENTNFGNVGDAAGLPKSVGDGSFEITLHTGTLVDASLQNTTEAAYTSYVRAVVARGVAEWTVSGTTPTEATNDNASSAWSTPFVQATGGGETETDFGIGSAIGAQELYIYGALTASLAVSNGILPEFAAGALDVQCT